MGKFEDLTGLKFGEWKVISRDYDYMEKVKGGIAPKKTMWTCECSCMKTKSVSSGDLKSGKSKSCGHNKYIEISNKTKGSKKKLNSYDLTKDFGVGKTSKGEEFYFDICDYNKIKEYSWYLKDGYPTTNSNNGSLKMHRLITDCPDDMVVDHMNRKRNDNRKGNLKICKQADNVKNVPLYKNNKSGCMGVNFNNNKWIVRISVNKNRIFIGEYDLYEEAVLARKQAEIKYWNC